MYLLASISNEYFDRVMKMRALARLAGIPASATRDASALLHGVRHSLGGRLVLLDWSKGEVLADKAIAGVSGLAVQAESIFASSWIDDCIHLLQPTDPNSTIVHPWFNYIHSVDVTGRGTLLVASAGTDLIAEVTSCGEIIWAWFGPEHGYRLRPGGTPTFFDRRATYRGMRRATDDLAMHVTSALEMSESAVLATLFHHGTLIRINRHTGAVANVLEGLQRPHGIHRRPGGFMLSDTLGHRVLLLNERLDVEKQLCCGSQWLQDAIVDSNGTYIALENVHIDQLPAPGLTNRLIEIDEDSRPVRSLEVGVQMRLFTVREVDAPLAHALALAWGKRTQFDHWRWN